MTKLSSWLAISTQLKPQKTKPVFSDFRFSIALSPQAGANLTQLCFQKLNKIRSFSQFSLPDHPRSTVSSKSSKRLKTWRSLPFDLSYKTLDKHSVSPVSRLNILSIWLLSSLIFSSDLLPDSRRTSRTGRIFPQVGSLTSTLPSRMCYDMYR